MNSAIRTHSKEQIHPVLLKRAPAPHGKQNGAKNKGFTISSPGSDEDEWVSSESGAATPSNDVDDDNEEEMSRTPVEHAKLNKAARSHRRQSEEPPRAETPIPRVHTARPNQPTQLSRAPDAVSAPHTTLHHSSQQPSSDMMVMTDVDVPPSHLRHTPHKRHSRPPSTHSLASKHDANLRPHPLIRGHSFGTGINLASKPVPLAPLADKSESSPGITASPPHSAVGNLSSSPTSIKTASGSPSSPSQVRRVSVSSARSAATLPVPQMNQQPSRAQLQDRTRTLSTLSSSSSNSVAALSSLVHFPAQTRPSTPQKVSYFPPPNPNINLEAIHPLLPPPYLSTHLTVLANRTPLRESYDRVIRAKQGR